MKHGVLIVVTADPRSSARAAEAVRIAAGTAAWQRVSVSLYLRDAATLALGEVTDELVDEDVFRQHLPDLAGAGQPVYVQAGAPWLKELGKAPVAFKEITDLQLGILAAHHRYVLRF
jgi:hypothetical protein